MTTAADLVEKTERYKRLLREALDDAKKVPGMDPMLAGIADDFYTMAESYYQDGTHFLEKDDRVNALVCFSYGHAWLDAGVRLGIFKVTKGDLFAA
jgi:uncharacterized protein